MRTIELTKEELEELLNGKAGEVIFGNLDVKVKKKVEKWEPKGGRHYISMEGQIMLSTQRSDEAICFGIHRETVDECVKAKDAIRTFNRLLAYRDEFDPDYEFTKGDDNCFVYYNILLSKYDYFWQQNHKMVGTVYMSEEVARELCRKLNSGEVVL